MLVKIANRGDPDQTASDLGLHCLYRPFGMQQVFNVLEHLLYAIHIMLNMAILALKFKILITQVNRMSKSRRVLATGGKQRFFGCTWSALR